MSKELICSNCGFIGKKLLKEVIGLFLIFLLMGCATPAQQLKATEGLSFETGKPREIVMDVLVNLFTAEGCVVDNIIEKYGLISCKPYKILTGQLMKKLGEPGSSLILDNSLIHMIDLSANVTQNGEVRLKAMAFNVQDENMFTMMANPNNSRRSERIDVFRTNKLNEYLMAKIKEKLK